jgi:hypothetical protein
MMMPLPRRALKMRTNAGLPNLHRIVFRFGSDIVAG